MFFYLDAVAVDWKRIIRQKQKLKFSKLGSHGTQTFTLLQNRLTLSVNLSLLEQDRQAEQRFEL